MTDAEIGQLFRSAGEIDAGLTVKPQLLPRLSRIAIKAEKYNRDSLFKNMASGEVSIFTDFPSPLKTARQRSSACPSGLILDAFHKSGIQERIRTKSGAKETWKYLTVGELAAKWQRNKARINVTDFHFRDTLIENVIDSSRLSQFNLYPCTANETSWLEMMTLVVSSSGAISDSHSDDSDGSNHCFTGKKLRLAWDTHEGISAGLQDMDRQKVNGRCAFDMETYLSLPSACWFTVEPGQTLFMPGHLTHKVLTLEPYLGVGSFYLALPNLLRTMARWLTHPPNWETLERKGFRDLVYPELINTALEKLKILERTTVKSRLMWGADYLKYSIHAWNERASRTEKSKLFAFKDLHNLCRLPITDV